MPRPHLQQTHATPPPDFHSPPPETILTNSWPWVALNVSSTQQQKPQPHAIVSSLQGDRVQAAGDICTICYMILKFQLPLLPTYSIPMHFKNCYKTKHMATFRSTLSMAESCLRKVWDRMEVTLAFQSAVWTMKWRSLSSLLSRKL